MKIDSERASYRQKERHAMDGSRALASMGCEIILVTHIFDYFTPPLEDERRKTEQQQHICNDTNDFA